MDRGRKGRFYRILGWRKIEHSMNFQMPVFRLESCWLLQSHLGNLLTKEPTCQRRRYKGHGFDPWVGKIPWRRTCNPLQSSCLESLMDRGAGSLQSMGLQRAGHDWDRFLKKKQQQQRFLKPILRNVDRLKIPLVWLWHAAGLGNYRNR